MAMDSFVNDDGGVDDVCPEPSFLTFDGTAVERLDRIEGMLLALMPIAEVFGQFGAMLDSGGGGGLLKMLSLGGR